MTAKKSVRVAAVVFSMTMFAGYVVHSQLERSRNIASSSKTGTLPVAAEQGDSGSAANGANSTNNVQKANISPLMDLLFGTYRCPGHEPEAFGIKEPIPKGYVSQLLHPVLPKKFLLNRSLNPPRSSN